MDEFNNQEANNDFGDFADFQEEAPAQAVKKHYRLNEGLVRQSIPILLPVYGCFPQIGVMLIKGVIESGTPENWLNLIQTHVGLFALEVPDAASLVSELIGALGRVTDDATYEACSVLAQQLDAAYAQFYGPNGLGAVDEEVLGRCRRGEHQRVGAGEIGLKCSFLRK